eukprot:3201447-Prymnesium_polylepis.1
MKGGPHYGNSSFATLKWKPRWDVSPQLFMESIKQSCLHPGRDVFQFGVYTGGAMKMMARVLPAFRRLVGFDSFQGVPEEDSNTDLGHPTWKKGGFSAADALGVYNLDELMSQVKANINDGRARLVPGFFNESLPKVNLDALCPPFLVDVDSDLYISAMQALDWLFESGLACPGMLLRYDDWPSSVPNEEDSTQDLSKGFLGILLETTLGLRRGSWANVGEVKAHRKISQKYGLTWRPLAKKQGEFVLVSIGGVADNRRPTRCGSCNDRSAPSSCEGVLSRRMGRPLAIN